MHINYRQLNQIIVQYSQSQYITNIRIDFIAIAQLSTTKIHFSATVQRQPKATAIDMTFCKV